MPELCWILLDIYWGIMKIEEVQFCRIDKATPWYKDNELNALDIDIVIQSYDYNMGHQVRDVIESNASALDIKIQGRIKLEIVLHCGKEIVLIG